MAQDFFHRSGAVPVTQPTASVVSTEIWNITEIFCCEGSAVSSTPFPASLLEELGMTDDVDNHDQDEGIDDDDDDVDEVVRYSWSDTISACHGNFHTMQPADHRYQLRRCLQTTI